MGTSDTYDAIVVGAGVIGAATALELARDGARVAIVDGGDVGAGSTAASSAVVRTFYSTRPACALAHEGFHAWRAFADHLGAMPRARLVERPALVMKTDANGHLADAMAMARDLGIPFEEWDAAQVARALPHYDLRLYAPPKRPDDPGFAEPAGGRLAGAVSWPRSGWVDDPQGAARDLVDAARRAGAETVRGVVEGIAGEAAFEGVRLEGGRVLRAPAGVLAVGPWSKALLARAGLDRDFAVRTRPLRQEVAHVPPPPGVDVDALPLVSDGDVGVYAKPDRGRLALGSEGPACDGEVEVAPEALDRSPTEQWTAQVMRYAQRAPTLGIPSRMAGVVDLYDASDDWLPIYDRTALRGLHVACGTSGNQFKNALVAGRLMAGLVAHGAEGRDHDADPLVVTLPRTGERLDLSAFSRRRAPAATTLSVLG